MTLAAARRTPYTPTSMPTAFAAGFPRPVRLLVLAQGALALAFLVTLLVVWRGLPAESVKLHGNIDTGVDLLGRRPELLWLLSVAVAITAGNAGLAAWLKRREPVAALFLLAATVPLLAGLTGALVFIALLNRPG